jgi:competence protein CoiA
VIYANTPSETRVTATPRARASCPACSGEVLAKCGKIVSWHWAHVGADCDPWSEPMTQWHLDWQAEAPPERREVIMGPHRADLVTPDGRVIELQHSSISVDDIQAREAHYGPMAWIFDARESYKERVVMGSDGLPSSKRRLSLRDKGDYVTFTWSYPRKTIAACGKSLFLDLDNKTLLAVGKIHPGTRFNGWGRLVKRENVVANLINGGAR